MADDSTIDDRNGFEDLDLSEWRGMNRLDCGTYTSRTDFYRTDDGRFLSVPMRWGPHATDSAVPFPAEELLSDEDSMGCTVTMRYLYEFCTPISVSDLPWRRHEK